MGHQIGLHRPGRDIVPLAEGADGHRPLEGAGSPALGVGATSHTPPMGRQQPIHRGRAQGQQALAHPGIERDLMVALERGHQVGEERDQALGAEVIARLPDPQQSRRHRCVIAPRAAGPMAPLPRAPAEQPEQGLAVVARDVLGFVQQPALLFAPGRLVARGHGGEIFVHAAGGHCASWVR